MTRHVVPSGLSAMMFAVRRSSLKTRNRLYYFNALKAYIINSVSIRYVLNVSVGKILNFMKSDVKLVLIKFYYCIILFKSMSHLIL